VWLLLIISNIALYVKFISVTNFTYIPNIPVTTDTAERITSHQLSTLVITPHGPCVHFLYVLLQVFGTPAKKKKTPTSGPFFVCCCCLESRTQ